MDRRDDGTVICIATRRPVTVGRREVMSKSKKNVVAPGTVIDSYGADTARWFILSDSPPDRDLEWTDAGVQGAWRFANRLWRMITGSLANLPAAGSAAPATFSDPAVTLRRATHRAIAQITADLDAFHFNGAVAKIYQLANALAEAPQEGAGMAWARREGFEMIVRLAGPMMPHLGEELWQQLGQKGLLVDTAWPAADPALVIDDQVTMAVQVSGKLRGTITVARDAVQAVLEERALAVDNVKKAIDGRPIRKVVIVPNRIVNVVV